MSKKKNTLKDLDAFLKQQASTLVPPAKLSEEKITEEKQQAPPAAVETSSTESHEPSADQLYHDLQALSKKEGSRFRHILYDLIVRSLEDHDQSLPEDKMLINTALYLKNRDRWKDAIREYWRKKQ